MHIKDFHIQYISPHYLCFSLEVDKPKDAYNKAISPWGQYTITRSHWIPKTGYVGDNFILTKEFLDPMSDSDDPNSYYTKVESSILREEEIIALFGQEFIFLFDSWKYGDFSKICNRYTVNLRFEDRTPTSRDFGRDL